jgi:diguanylate cyclase (GGDEF)-like protein
MYDAVLFLDANMQIMLWNRGMERLTGIVSANTYQKIYDPQIIQMRDERGYDITELDCPISFALKSRVQSMRRMIIHGRNKNDVSVNVHTIPVVDSDGTLFGAAVLMHDASGEVSLEEQCQDWQARATRDQLTQLANRAEFDREIEKLVKEHIDRGLPCSLIITDIDRFKSVNDNYGHQVGDEVLVSFAQTLKSVCPSSFIVARYGGEEFVILCATTDCATAARLADEIRRTWSQIPQPGMGGKSVTSSFGVTELQNGDTPDIILRRADRALYMAKEAGRNKVVQLGTGLDNESAPERRKRGWWPWRWRQETAEYCRNMVTLVPLPMTIEKLRGFISDHGATVLTTDDHSIRLEVTSTPKMHKRSSDRPETMTLELRFIESNQTIKIDHESPARTVHCTKIAAKAMPKRLRNRRSDSVEEAAKQVLASIKAYLMAQDDHELPMQECE